MTKKQVHKLLPSETILEDDYPMFFNYVYIIDGVFARSNSQCTVGEYKAHNYVKEIRRCEIFEHKNARLGDRCVP